MITKIRWLKYLRFILFIVLLAHSLFTATGGTIRSAGAQPLVTRQNSLPFTARDASQFDAQVPLTWYKLVYDLVRNERFSPPLASRTFGYLGVALYEAVVPGMPGYQSLAGQLNGLQELPPLADPAYHWPTVANSALASAMNGLFPAGSRPAIQALERQFGGEFQPGLPPGIYKRSVARGQSVAQAILQWAKVDGYENIQDCAYLPPAGAGLWTPTPPGFAPALLPCWGELRPFVLGDGSECSPPPPSAYSEDPTSDFYREALEVYTTVNQLTPEQLDIALFWADDPGRTGTPPGHSISILGQALVQEGASLQVASEAYARLGIALADSFIACWWTKYEHNLLRPITYIHNVFGDMDWNTAVNTPPFPEYTSGHSVQSAAAAQVLTDLFGEVEFTDHTHNRLGYTPRSFANFFAFAEEAAISRLYGGIHFRPAIEFGLTQGKCIGDKVNALTFKKAFGN